MQLSRMCRSFGDSSRRSSPPASVGGLVAAAVRERKGRVPDARDDPEQDAGCRTTEIRPLLVSNIVTNGHFASIRQVPRRHENTNQGGAVG
jgi:hypothetical protein